MEFLIETGDNVVEAWSATRLQFEPKGWQREFRAALRDAVAAIPPTGTLRANYCSPDTASVDAENVLFYNVGLSCFARATRNGLQFERGYGLPRSTTPPMHHYHRYESVASVGEFELWQPTAVLASFTDLAFARADELMQVAPIWARIRRQFGEPPWRGPRVPSGYTLCCACRPSSGLPPRLSSNRWSTEWSRACSTTAHNLALSAERWLDS